MPKSNNFDLIRLFAAMQVAIAHTLEHLQLAMPWAFLADILRVFPGVPIFFFVSGFLITRSYERNPSLRDFMLNRCLRIYPALIVCLAVSVGSVFFVGYFRTSTAGIGDFAVWIAAQITIGQFYNPSFLRHYGVGVLNGSVWTICVELQFYVLTPIIYHLSKSRCKTPSSGNLLYVGLIVGFLVANRLYFSPPLVAHAASLGYKLFGVTFLPWFYMFLAGALVQRNLDYFQAKLSGRFGIVLPMYVGLALAANRWGGLSLGNELDPLIFAALVATVFAAAFSSPGWSDRLLRRNDVSYGVYIYHMPIVNLALAGGYAGSYAVFFACMAATVAMATLSWLAIEKPALNLKKRPLYSHVTR